MAFIAVSGVCTLALSWRRGWGWRPGALDATEVALRWGYANYQGLLAAEGARLHRTLGVGAQVFGALVVVALSISVLFALYVLHTSVMFSRGWYEAASAAGGLRAALPGFAVGVRRRREVFLGEQEREEGERARERRERAREREESERARERKEKRKEERKTHLFLHQKKKPQNLLLKGNLLLWSGVFYGLSQFRVHFLVPGPRRLRPGWAFYLSLGQTIAWLVASHVLARMPPVELVQAWTGNIANAAASTAAPAAASNGSGIGAPAAAPARSSSVKLRPILGKLPSALRTSLGKVPGVEIV